MFNSFRYVIEKKYIDIDENEEKDDSKNNKIISLINILSIQSRKSLVLYSHFVKNNITSMVGELLKRNVDVCILSDIKSEKLRQLKASHRIYFMVKTDVEGYENYLTSIGDIIFYDGNSSNINIVKNLSKISSVSKIKIHDFTLQT